MLNIVLVEPEIPSNTGNIARSCAATGTALHLIEPLGFSISDKAVKRAGLDYWHLVDIKTYPDLDTFFARNPGARCWYATTKAPRAYTEVDYREDDFLVFGKETKGLSETLLEAHRDCCVRIPIRAEARSLNLSNSVAVILFEALRQLGQPGLESTGKMAAY